MKKSFILGLTVGIFVPFIGAFIFIVSGRMPVATKSPPLPFEKFLANSAIHAALENEIGKKSPVPLSEVNFVSGAKIYKTQCLVCHGQPNSPVNFIAEGMFPRPPQLFSSEGNVTDDPVGNIFWKIK
ncbi:MAG: hypothetical protein JWQ35_997, partial [Bacteriovoracaceae bacterium]|nr:hypothetical protein [Bacteriovoracaceae bacterium]